jgi:hypothetical protein
MSHNSSHVIISAIGPILRKLLRALEDVFMEEDAED